MKPTEKEMLFGNALILFGILLHFLFTANWLVGIFWTLLPIAGISIVLYGFFRKDE